MVDDQGRNQQLFVNIGRKNIQPERIHNFAKDVPENRMSSVRDCIVFIFGHIMAVLGNQFHLVALSWLALSLTGDIFTMASILAIAEFPKALGLLIGGVLTDQCSPRKSMYYAAFMRIIVTGIFTIMLMTDAVYLSGLYAFAIVYGLSEAILLPAQQTMTPRLVPGKYLRHANGVVEMVHLVCCGIGPILAAISISAVSQATLTPNEHDSNLVGLSIAFGIDAICTLLLIVAVAVMPRELDICIPRGRSLSLFWQGIRAIIRDAPMRTVFLIIAVANIIVSGPVIVGLPSLIKSRLGSEVITYGMLLSIYGCGELFGAILAVILPESPRYLGRVLLSLAGILGALLAAISIVQTKISAGGIIAAMGGIEGYIGVKILTWVQKRSSQHMLGRIMGVMLFTTVGMFPLSTIMAGAISKLGLGNMFAIPGVLMIIISVALFKNPIVWNLNIVDKSGSALHSYDEKRRHG